MCKEPVITPSLHQPIPLLIFPLIPFATPRAQHSRHKPESGDPGPTPTMIILAVEGRYTTSMVHRPDSAAVEYPTLRHPSFDCVQSTSTFTVPTSSALGIRTVRIPSVNLAETLLAFAGRGSHTVRVNDELPVNVRSTDSWFDVSSGLATAGFDAAVSRLAPASLAADKKKIEWDYLQCW